MTKPNIHIITPALSRGVQSRANAGLFERDGFLISYSVIEAVPGINNSLLDESSSVAGILKKATEAEKAGADAIIIDGLADIGLKECREVVSIPVLGTSQTAMHMATMLGGRFSFIAVHDHSRLMVERVVEEYGLTQHFASFEAVKASDSGVQQPIGKLVHELTQVSIKAVIEHHVGAIVLGTTAFPGCAEMISDDLCAKGLNVPVIDPISLTLRMADTFVRTGLKHSKHIYQIPSENPIRRNGVSFVHA